MEANINIGGCIVAGNYQLDRVSKNEYVINYVGDGWESKSLTKKQVEKASSFFELFNPIKL